MDQPAPFHGWVENRYVSSEGKDGDRLERLSRPAGIEGVPFGLEGFLGWGQHLAWQDDASGAE